MDKHDSITKDDIEKKAKELKKKSKNLGDNKLSDIQFAEIKNDKIIKKTKELKRIRDKIVREEEKITIESEKNDDKKSKSDNRDKIRGCKILLKSVAEKSGGRRWMHDKERSFYQTIDKVFFYIILFLGTLLSFLTSGDFLTFLIDNGLRSNAILGNILTACELSLGVLITFLTAIREAGKFSDKKHRHDVASHKFNTMYHEIKRKVTTEDLKIEDFKKLTNDQSLLFDEVVENSPNIRNSVRKKYFKYAEDKEIFKPFEVEEFDINTIRVLTSPRKRTLVRKKIIKSSKLKDKEASVSDSILNFHSKHYEIDRFFNLY